MSRQRAILPAINTAGGQDTDGFDTSRSLNRIDYLEDRVKLQERTSQGLLDRAYRIKEDIIDNLSITHGTWQEEKRARELLQEHIRTITDVVRKLSKDIQHVEDQIQAKAGASAGTQNAVNNLEMHHVAGLTDLRGRVARCDASIARLSSDLKGCFDTARSVGEAQQHGTSNTMQRLNQLDMKISELTTLLDKKHMETEIHLRNVEIDSGKQLNIVDSKTRTMIEETRNSVSTNRVIEETERERMEARLLGSVERTNNNQSIKLDKVEKHLEDVVMVMNRRIAELETELQQEKERTTTAQKALEIKLNSIMDSHMKQQQTEVAKLKRECREGFSTVHESITNMKQVMEGKQKLMEEQLRKEISQIRKMVVLI